MPVHMLGNPCDMNTIIDIAKEHNLYVIEDACQATGGSYKNKKLGSFGDINAFSLNFFKTITAGDGGVVVTNNYNLYEKAFGFHDQGHKPYRLGQEVGKRSIIGLNFRMNELTGAVALAQLRKLDKIISTLQGKKRILKDDLNKISGVGFRKINDKGECATLLTLLFNDKENANKFAEKIGTQVLSHSGWHVYNNMEQIIGKKMPTDINCPFICEAYGKSIEYKPHMLPITDNILNCAVNISVGVVDKGIGAPFGITILSTDQEIIDVADKIKKIVKEL